MYVPEFLSDRKNVASSDVPRVLYQCADCELLFDALLLWQQHRKLGCSPKTGSGPGPGDEAATSVLPPISQEVTHETEVACAAQPVESEGEAIVETLTPVNAEITKVKSEGISQPVLPGSSDPPEPPEEPAPQLPERTEPAQEPSLPVRRRGQKKAKPPSSLLCVECGRCFSLASELVSHRKTAHNLKEAIHRCNVCGEGFLNTTLFLYHRKQHRSQTQEEEPKEVEVPQLSTTLLEAPGEGLLLLATAGEGQSLMEITTLEQTVPEAVPIHQVEVELNPEIRAEVIQAASGDEAAPEAVESEQIEETEVEGIVSMEEEEVASRAEHTNEEVVEEKQVEAETSSVDMAHADETASSALSTSPSFLCSQCGCSFNAEQELARHRSSEHGLAEALHSCPECGQEFMNTTQFLYHRREHRKDVSPPSARLNTTLTSLAKHPPASSAILLRRPGQWLLTFISAQQAEFQNLTAASYRDDIDTGKENRSRISNPVLNLGPIELCICCLGLWYYETHDVICSDLWFSVRFLHSTGLTSVSGARQGTRLY